MNTVALEELVAGTILCFCQNAAKFGCPPDQKVDVWFRSLSYSEMLKVADKLIGIIDEQSKT